MFKKCITLVLIFVLLVSTIFPVYAANTSNDNELNGVELSIRRIRGDLHNQSKEEIGRSILSEMGMSQENIDLLTTEKLIEIAEATSIVSNSQYCKINENGNEEILTESEFQRSLSSIQSVQDGVAITSDIELEEGEEYHPPQQEDSLFIKNLFVYRTANAPKGTYGIFSIWEWKPISFPLAWRGYDVIGISGEDLVFSLEDFSLTASYQKDTLYDTDHIVEEILEFITYATPNNDIRASENSITCGYNLPNDSSNLTESVAYRSMNFLATANARINGINNHHLFNVYTNYFHQTVGIGSFNVSVNISGVDISISPSWRYDTYSLSTAQRIEYNP